MTDYERWQQLKEGREDALEYIYRAHIEALLAYGQRFSGDTGLVEDCIHDLFVGLWKNRQGLSSNDAIRPYLLVALRRRIIKKLQRRQKYEDPHPPEEVAFDAELAVDEQLIGQEQSRERAQKLKAAFSQLSKRQREAIYLKYYQGLGYEEICKIMDINYQSARNLVFAGLRAMRKLLALLCGWWWF